MWGKAQIAGWEGPEDRRGRSEADLLVIQVEASERVTRRVKDRGEWQAICISRHWTGLVCGLHLFLPGPYQVTFLPTHWTSRHA